MRALHVFPAFSPASADPHETYAGHLTQALRDLGIKVDALHANRPSIPVLAKLWSALGRCDVVLAGFLPQPLLSSVLRLAKTRNKPVVILPSLDDKLPGDPATLGRLLGAAAATLAVTEESAREISRLCSNCKISEIGIGVDPAAFDNAAISGARFRSKYDLGDRPFLFTPPGKGVDLALEAMYFFVPGSLLLVIAGEPSAGKLPSDRVKFVGPLTRAEMWDAYDACDVIMFASPEEKSRSPLLEAWARGKPVLANPNSEAASELMDDAVDGFLCDNSRTISKRAQLLLDHPALSRKMGEAGRRKLLAQHTWEQVAKRVRVVYESCGARCAIPQGQK